MVRHLPSRCLPNVLGFQRCQVSKKQNSERACEILISEYHLGTETAARRRAARASIHSASVTLTLSLCHSVTVDSRIPPSQSQGHIRVSVVVACVTRRVPLHFPRSARAPGGYLDRRPSDEPLCWSLPSIFCLFLLSVAFRPLHLQCLPRLRRVGV